MVNNSLTKYEFILLGLLKQALFGIPFTPHANNNWDEVFQEAQLQSVTSLIAKYVPDNAGSAWKTSYSSNIANSIRYLHAQSDLIDLFNRNNIPIAILKGSAVALYYPVPTQRARGDIDFIVPQDCYEAACSLMIKSGYILHKDIPTYTRHKGFKQDKTSFELHHHFSYDDLDIEQYIIEGLKNLDTGKIDAISFPMLPRLANGLVLLAHMRNHLQTGLGLRQVIDWMMYVDKVLDDDFWECEFKNAAESTGMDQLAITVTRMCQIYLGLREDITWCKEANENLCDSLMQTLLSYGNFGRKHGVGNKVETVITIFRKKRLFHYLQTAGEYNWEMYRKHSWLKPFCWIYQICRLALKGIKAGRGKSVVQDIDSANNRYELLKQLKVIK